MKTRHCYEQVERHRGRGRSDMILLASSRADVIARWREALDGFAPVCVVDRLGTLRDVLAKQDAHILLLDLDMNGIGSPVDVQHSQV